ncbi:MAG: pentapeptide repeat-containing protein [Bacteriovoracia bacterium]
MKIKWIVAGVGFAWAMTGPATVQDHGFRFRDGVCQDERGLRGLNPGYFGQCGDLSGAVLAKLDLSGTDFSGTLLSSAILTQVSFKGATLKGVRFDSSRFEDVKFDDALVQGADFSRGTFKRVTFLNAKLSSTRFVGSDLQGTVADQFACEKCDFTGAFLNGVTWTSAQLEGGKFVRANLSSANLSRANLGGADFSEARVTSAVLERATLSRAEMRGANFRAAKLKGAIVADVRWAGAVYSRKTILPFSETDAKDLGMILKGAECQAGTDVEVDEICYYLDGSGGNCAEDFMLAPQSILATIGTKFVGKTYRTKVSDNCCVYHAEVAKEGEDYGAQIDCNEPGPFKEGVILNGAGCTDVQNKQPAQLTLCMSKE